MITKVLSRWKDHLLDSTFGPVCPHCDTRSMDPQPRQYIRGWNTWCEQAVGDAGNWCYNCEAVVWHRGYDEFKQSLPEWCYAHPEKHKQP